jgi:rubrerythrin
MTVMEARGAVQALRQAGIPAQVINTIDAMGGVMLSTRGPYVVVVQRPRLDEARSVVRRHNAERPALRALDAEALRPDLAKLPTGLEVACSACGATLPPTDGPVACPACGAEQDFVDRAVDQHGPEVLAACYDEVVAEGDPTDLTPAAATCPGCGYQLAGLPGAGVCPECGQAYHKLELLTGDDPRT